MATDQYLSKIDRYKICFGVMILVVLFTLTGFANDIAHYDSIHFFYCLCSVSYVWTVIDVFILKRKRLDTIMPWGRWCLIRMFIEGILGLIFVITDIRIFVDIFDTYDVGLMILTTIFGVSMAGCHFWDGYYYYYQRFKVPARKYQKSCFLDGLKIFVHKK